jgi:Family of unknown function (DUF5947)
MATPTGNFERGALATLQRFVRRPSEKAETCELCATRISPVHQHVLELEKRRVACACDPCAILFSGSSHQRYRRIPRDVRVLRNFVMEDQEWESLLIPINLAYFVHHSLQEKVVAQYPSPGGAMESLLDLEYWNAIVERNPQVKNFEPDVEALLVNRIATVPQYYRVPIDQCFRLVGLIRVHWHGLSGGTEVWEKIYDFFHELNAASGDPLA